MRSPRATFAGRHLSVILLALVLWSFPLAASAQVDVLAGWVTSPRYGEVRRLAEDARIELIPSEPQWTRAEIAAIAEGARALPPALIEGLARPVRMKRVGHECLFGVGRFSEGCPTYDDDGAFLVYDLPPLQGEGPVERLAPLDAAERVEIQRRRAAVHALLLAWDRTHRWSEDVQWRRINGWRAAQQPFNRDLWGYSRYLGYRSPQMDLVTFAEDWFVRPEDVIAPERRDTVLADLSVECQEFTKSRFLAARIAALDPAWSPPRRTRGVPQCPAFEAWARLSALESVDLLLAAATAERPESLYGHLLLHLRYADRAEGFEPVYQFGAVTDSNVAPLTYLSRGLLGGFLSVIELNSFRGVDRLFLQYEQRSLKRYELRLSPRQKRRLLERIWEYERRVRYPYHFFANNCASFLLDLIGPALELDIPDRPRLIVAPADVLDFLAAIDNPGRGPLLRKRPQTEYSSREIAQRSLDDRRATRDVLLATLQLSAEGRGLLRQWDGDLDSTRPEQRKAAYEGLGALLTSALNTARSPVAIEAVITYLHHCVQIERYFAEEAFYTARTIKLRALADPLHYTAAELLQRRRELVRTEDVQARDEALRDWTEVNEKRLVDGPFRKLTPRETQQLAAARSAEAAYIASLDAQATIIERFAPDLDGTAFLQARADAFRAEQARRDALATGPSGKGRISVGGAASTPDAATLQGGFAGSYAFIYERLGEQRRRGFRSDIENRALGFDLYIPFSETFWRELDFDATLLRFLTIEQKLGPLRRNLLSRFGWGFEGGLGHDGRRGLRLDAGAAGGIVLPVFQTDGAANHLALGVWADARVHLGRQGRRILAGGDGFARLSIHLGGVYANSLRLEAGSRHWFAFETLSYEWAQRARLATEHALTFVGEHPLVLSPWLLGEWTSVDYSGRDEFHELRAGISLELPL